LLDHAAALAAIRVCVDDYLRAGKPDAGSTGVMTAARERPS
jgi:hypothetical protein